MYTEYNINVNVLGARYICEKGISPPPPALDVVSVKKVDDLNLITELLTAWNPIKFVYKQSNKISEAH